MEFDELNKRFLELEKLRIPGEDAHAEVFPGIAKFRQEALSKNPNPRLSAVGATFVPIDSIAHILLIERQSYDGVHSGQIGFPGGKVEDEDDSLEHTARRETEEEIGVNRETLQFVGKLTEVYIPPSGFLVKPFIFKLDFLPELRPDPREVQSIITMPVTKLLEENAFVQGAVPTGRGTSVQTKFIYFQDKKIWGATAMMLSELRILLQQTNRK
jgi:8-oxo-dGTP pyrophosphatase MutT (NUDIX family)